MRSVFRPLGAWCLATAALFPVRAQTAATAPPPPTMTAEATAAAEVSEGRIAWYGSQFSGRRTASGQRFNAEALTMAHRTLPFGTQVRVTNLSNQRSVVLRVNDRGPTARDRIGDVSAAAARKLRMQRDGVVDARLEVVSMGKAG